MRSGLITAVAILTILFVASTIFAIYYGVLAQRTQDDYDKYRLNLATVVKDTNSNDVRELMKDTEFPHQPAMIVALDQRAALVRAITGKDDQTQAFARDDAKHAIKDAQDAIGADVQLPQSLDGALRTLAQQVTTLKGTIEALNTDKAQDKAALDATVKKDAAAVAAVEAQVAQANEEKQAAINASQAQQAAKDQQIDALGKNAAAERATLQSQNDKVTAAYNDGKTQLEVLKKQIAALALKLAAHRVDVRQAVIDRPDGQIVKVSSDNIVYINLGYGDHIAPGLTFEVYDGRLPLPKLPNLADDDTMPVGKASIEIIKVDQGSSECRVISTGTGQTIVPGDKILNLVYDRNTKFNFVVYGDFDINNTGKPVPQDTQVIKRLVTQWGGTVKDAIAPDTDFIIMGKEPEVPQFSADDLKDPFNKQKQEDAITAADAYDDMAKHAADLGVPILNQNRFLYYVGYFDLVSR
jgi:hypothetical protein